MPCTAKKGEAGRPEMDSAYRWWREKRKRRDEDEQEHYRDVDWAITTRELARMIRQSAIDMASLPEENFDSQPRGIHRRRETIFGNTGGVMEAALRTVYEILEGKALPSDRLPPRRGLAGHQNRGGAGRRHEGQGWL
jgi:iron only hydrogenase large subunit-like protein